MARPFLRLPNYARAPRTRPVRHGDDRRAGSPTDEYTSATGALAGQHAGTSEVLAYFDSNGINVLFTEGSASPAFVLSGSGDFSGTQYSGTFNPPGSGGHAGNFNGALFGPNAEATAGTFGTENTATGNAYVGAFTGFDTGLPGSL